MKPLPEAVQAAFPCLPNRLPSRPWWQNANWAYQGHPTYLRVSDGRGQESGGNLALTVYPTPDRVAGIDSEHPLPHPGFRAGQVWAAENGESIVVVAILLGQVCIAHDENGWYPSTFARAYPYLMADPACPWLAPWSPAEKAKP
jgi:hypothetical protein